MSKSMEKSDCDGGRKSAQNWVSSQHWGSGQSFEREQSIFCTSNHFVLGLETIWVAFITVLGSFAGFLF